MTRNTLVQLYIQSLGKKGNVMKNTSQNTTYISTNLYAQSSPFPARRINGKNVPIEASCSPQNSHFRPLRIKTLFRQGGGGFNSYPRRFSPLIFFRRTKNILITCKTKMIKMITPRVIHLPIVIAQLYHSVGG